MRTITFDKYNSYHDLGMILSKTTIGAAEPKTYTVDVPCGDGDLDYTEYFGRILYKNRLLSFEFTLNCEAKYFLREYSRIQNLLNGRKMKITLSNDPDFYYVGRAKVNDWESEKNIGKVVVSVTAEPYKMKHAVTVIYRTITGVSVINCHNLKKTVEPKISFTTAGASGTVALYDEKEGKFTDESEEFSHVCEDTVVFGEGDNVLRVTPAAGATLPMGVMIEYREGGL